MGEGRALEGFHLTFMAIVFAELLTGEFVTALPV